MKMEHQDFPEAKFARVSPSRKLHKLWDTGTPRAPLCGSVGSFHVGDEFFDEAPYDAEMCIKCASMVNDPQANPEIQGGKYLKPEAIRWMVASLTSELKDPVLKDLAKDLGRTALDWRDLALSKGHEPEEEGADGMPDGEAFRDGMRYKAINYFGQHCILACDNKCDKAWGRNGRERVYLGDLDENGDIANPDDYGYLGDGELGTAPEDPGTYEGGEGKPLAGAPMNKWCTRECERSTIVRIKETPVLYDFSDRLYNMKKRDYLRLTEGERELLRNNKTNEAYESYSKRTDASPKDAGDVFCGFMRSIGVCSNPRHLFKFPFERGEV